MPWITRERWGWAGLDMRRQSNGEYICLSAGSGLQKTTSQTLTQDLYFHYLLGKHASGLAWKASHRFTLQPGLFLPHEDSLPTSTLNWRGAGSFSQTWHQNLLFWPPPSRVSPDHSALTIKPATLLTARGLTRGVGGGLLRCHDKQWQAEGSQNRRWGALIGHRLQVITWYILET